MSRLTTRINPTMVWRAAAAMVLAACTHQGGVPATSISRDVDTGLIDTGRAVFRFETFGNERFFSEILGLDDGLSERLVTPNDLLRVGLQFDADKVPSEFRRVAVGDGVYGEPIGTRRLIEANAVIGIVMRRGRIGITCGLCHARADDRLGPGIGRRLDGVPNVTLAVGELLSWGTRSRAYLPFTNVSGVGREPEVPLASAGDPEVVEALVDAALRSWPRGQADAIPDGVGNPTDFPALFVVRDHGPYLWDGSFARSRDTAHFFATIVFDPTTLATRWGRGFLRDGPFYPVGPELSRAYDRILHAIDSSDLWPRGTIFRSSVFSLFHDPLDAGFRVSRADVTSLTAYLSELTPTDLPSPDPSVVARGRRVFRNVGCDACHLESAVASGAVVSLERLVPGYGPAEGHLDDPAIHYDDRVVLTSGEDAIERRGYKAPSLLGLRWSAPFLHDGSVESLEHLFDPIRGEAAPHPFFIRDEQDRQALVGYLVLWDGRRYP